MGGRVPRDDALPRILAGQLGGDLLYMDDKILQVPEIKMKLVVGFKIPRQSFVAEALPALGVGFVCRLFKKAGIRQPVRQVLAPLPNLIAG